MEFYKKSAQTVVKHLNTDSANGLTDGQVAESAEKYGINQMTKAKNKSVFKRIWEALTEPMVMVLVFAGLITLAVNIIRLVRGSHTEFIECAGIAVAIILSVSITIIMEGRSAKAFDALNKIGENIQIKTYRNGQLTKISQEKLVVGDIVKLEVGDKIPVDCRLIECTSLSVDESPLTGESAPVKKDANLILEGEKIALAERKNMVYGGCFVTAGNAVAVVTGVGDGTELGLIAKELSVVDTTITPLQEKLKKLGKKITIIGASAAALVFVIQLIKLFAISNVNFESVQEVFITSIVLIVAAVPEGLPTIVAVSLALNVIKMAKQNALVKKLVACETVGCISIICSDKTGTLTENKMTVTSVYSLGGEIKPEELTDANLIRNFVLNSSGNVQLREDKTYNFIGNPTECALLVAYNKTNPDMTYLQMRDSNITEHNYPFSSELKKMTTIVREDKSLVAYAKGAPEIIIEMCKLDAEQKQKMLDAIGSYQKQAKRVIGFSHKTVKPFDDYETARINVEKDMIFDGFVVITDPIRKEVYAAVASSMKAGVGIKMLTGDNIITARAIAAELGIIDNDNQVFNAIDIENMNDEQLEKNISHIRVVARSTPLTKLRIVNMLKKMGEVVAVTGDGINDAPAIKNADVGIAMGITGTEVSKEASDIVLLDDSFSTIVKSVHWGRGIYENFQRFIMFQLVVNLSAVVVVIASIIFGFESPFSALELLWINIIMDGPPALTLGLEAMHKDLMDRQPTSRNASIVTKNMFIRIALNGCFISALFLIQTFTNFMGAGSVEEKKTVLFTLFVVFQLFNAFNSREMGDNSIFGSLLKNKVMLLVMLVTFGLQVVITQFGGVIFGTVPLGIIMWLKIVGIGVTVIVFSEIYKLITRIVKKVKANKIKKNNIGAIA